ncbi:MAG: hypothetical protein IJR69_06700 [Bacteroidaceae bacterium]|nr:hypothetical protein [Bacteroidaceae bacterium]
MLIDVTSFTSGPRQIENAVETQKTANHVAVAERIKGYIDFYQSEFLRRAVGKQWCSLIDEYSRVSHEVPENENAEGDGNAEEPVEEMTPVEPTEEENNIAALADMLKEPFADYVFFYMLRDMNVQPTITGLVQLKCANSYVSPLQKGVQTWNRMVDGLRLFASEVAVEGVSIDKDMLTYINQFNL